jgi:hypothetical protein
VAELALRLPSCVGRRESVADQIIGPRGEVMLELLAHLALGLAAMHQRAIHRAPARHQRRDRAPPREVTHVRSPAAWR